MASASRSFTKAVWIFFAVLLIGVTAWTWFSLTWAYGEGERAGVLQKFSKKGWLCKTYEGELALYVVGGVGPQIWFFSSRDEAVAEELKKNVGARVQLHYTEHKGVPTTCFAETPYFAEGVTVLSDQKELKP